jgi:hypothetical protein
MLPHSKYDELMISDHNVSPSISQNPLPVERMTSLENAETGSEGNSTEAPGRNVCPSKVGPPIVLTSEPNSITLRRTKRYSELGVLHPEHCN